MLSRSDLPIVVEIWIDDASVHFQTVHNVDDMSVGGQSHQRASPCLTGPYKEQMQHQQFGRSKAKQDTEARNRVPDFNTACAFMAAMSYPGYFSLKSFKAGGAQTAETCS